MGLNQRTDDRADDGQGTGERPAPRHGRAALLRLASWFEEAGTDRADDLARAAYALHPALHIEGRVDEGIAATTAWWQAEPDRSAVVEHPGTRPPAPVRDHRAQQARLRDAAESSAHWRRAGASQIRALLTEPTGDRAHVDLSGAGMEVLMELLTAALGAGDAARRSTSAGDLEFSLRLHVVSAPGAEVTVQGEGGDLTLEGVRLCVTPYEQHELDLPESAGSGDGAPFGLGRPRGTTVADRQSSEGRGAAGPATDLPADPRHEAPADSRHEAPAEPAADPSARPAPDSPPESESESESVPGAPSGSDADVLAGPGGDDLLGPVSGTSADPAHSTDPAESGGFAELAGAVAEALTLARADEETAEPEEPEQPAAPDKPTDPAAPEEPAAAPGDDDGVPPSARAPLGRRHARPEGAPSDDESADSPVGDPGTSDSLAEPDRDPHLDPNTETTGPIDLSAIRDGERSAWG